MTKEQIFQNNSNKVHNNFYDYSSVKYINNHTKVCIICPFHGEFWQRPTNHLRGQGCPECKRSKLRKRFQLSNKEIVCRFIETHGDLYDYSKVQYTNYNTKVTILCSEHGEFQQTPDNHLKGKGCPKCHKSKGERKIERWLNENNIPFEFQKKFKECHNIYQLPFDFFLPELNICIEFDGQQHYYPTGFGGDPHKKLQRTKKNDNIKNEFCLKNNIKLIRIPYWKRNIPKILSSIL